MTSPRRSARPPVVAVIGSGFSGLLTAIHLLRGDPAVRVRLVERGDRFGPGRAYATGNPHHLLNVRAGNMSAFPDRPDHFLTWAGVSHDAFVARGAYGRYLQALLDRELNDADHGARLDRLTAQAVAAWPDAGCWRIRLDDGAAIQADAVVLAVGFLAAAWPREVEQEHQSSRAAVADPWSTDLQALPDGDILLLGAGLTMVDVALALARPGRRLTALSRRGLLPLGHAPTQAAPPPTGSMSTPAQALAVLRDHAATVGWRAAVDSIRPLTPGIWRSWTPAQRRRFLRHLRPWWDIHRHRMAPQVASRIADLRGSGALTVRAGRLQGLGGAGAIDARIRFRGETSAWTGRFAAVVNCASPDGDPRREAQGLVHDLHRRGLARADPLGLGLDMDDRLGVVGADGTVSPGLFAVGPLTRGRIWEAVAVPDLRGQAAEAARSVLDWLKRTEA